MGYFAMIFKEKVRGGGVIFLPNSSSRGVSVGVVKVVGGGGELCG